MIHVQPDYVKYIIYKEAVHPTISMLGDAKLIGCANKFAFIRNAKGAFRCLGPFYRVTPKCASPVCQNFLRG